MSWIIRDAQGAVCGVCTHKPGADNKRPDGTDEVSQYMEEDPKEPGYDPALIQEADAFRASQAAKVALAEKRAAAMAALEAQRLAEAMTDPNAPQAVKDCVEATK